MKLFAEHKALGTISISDLDLPRESGTPTTCVGILHVRIDPVRRGLLLCKLASSTANRHNTMKLVQNHLSARNGNHRPV